MDKQVRRALLKPLNRRRQRIADRNAIVAALGRLDERALGEQDLPRILADFSAVRSDRRPGSWKDPEVAKRFVALAKSLHAARRISRQEYVFYASWPVEGVHETRWLNGLYKTNLHEINRAMDAIKQDHGLQPEEYWPVGRGPVDYIRLSEEYNRVLRVAFSRTLREFGLDDLADLNEDDPNTFDRLRERGRRSVFHKDELAQALKDVVVRYEEDARRAASARSYSAAITLLGAGMEGVLLLRCLRSKKKALGVASALPKRQRPRFTEDPTTWSFQTLIDECLAAGWLPPISSSTAQYSPAGLAHVLRQMRNYVHPGKYARERPWSEPDEGEYKDAESIYGSLLATVIK
jgi:hypothetical protein